MKKNQVRIMTEIGVAVALCVIFNFIRLWRMPQGGSVTLEMLPIFIIALRWGGGPGLIVGLIYGLVQLILGAYIVHPMQLILDYPLAYMLVGLAGFLPINKKTKGGLLYSRLFLAILLGGLGRFFCHLLSGVIFFGQYVPEGQNPWLYSTIYNGSFLIPTLILNYLIIISLFNKLILNKDTQR